MKKLAIWLLTLTLLLGLAPPAWAASPSSERLGYQEQDSNNDGDDLEDLKDYQYEEAYAAALDKQEADGYVEGYAAALLGKPAIQPLYPEDALYLAWFAGYTRGHQAAVLDKSIRDSLSALGGTPGQINLRLSDTCVPFTDAFPEIKEGRTMVPLRAVMEALGATLGQEADQGILIQANNRMVHMQHDSKTVTLSRDGKTETLLLEQAPYEKDGRTYVPLRFLAEAFGYRVDWDATYQCVLMLDTAKLQADLDARFAIVNETLKKQAQRQGNETSEGSVSLAIEQMEGSHEDKIDAVSGSFTLHTGASALCADLTLDLTALLPLAEHLFPDGQRWFASTKEALALYKSLFRQQTVSLKQQPDGQLYVKSALLDIIYTRTHSTSFDSAKETWYDLGKNEDLTMWQAGKMQSVGAKLLEDFLGERSDKPYVAYDQLLGRANRLETLVGDRTFQKQGGISTWTGDKTKLLPLIKESMEERDALMWNTLLKALDVKLAFREDGTYQLNATGTLNRAALGEQWTLPSRHALHVTIQSKSKPQKGNAAPDTTLPQGAQVLQW